MLFTVDKSAVVLMAALQTLFLVNCSQQWNCRGKTVASRCIFAKCSLSLNWKFELISWPLKVIHNTKNWRWSARLNVLVTKQSKKKAKQTKQSKTISGEFHRDLRTFPWGWNWSFRYAVYVISWCNLSISFRYSDLPCPFCSFICRILKLSLA